MARHAAQSGDKDASPSDQDGDQEDRRLPSLTASLVERKGLGAAPLLLGDALAQRILAKPVDGFLVRKGEAAPSVDAKSFVLEPTDKRPEDDTLMVHLREELAQLKAKLADSEAALAEAASSAEHARENIQREIRQALSTAEATWKAEAAARFAAAEDAWRRQLDAALAEAALAAEQARDDAQREMQKALSTAEAAWKADEAARFTAAEGGWRRQSEDTLAQAASSAEQARKDVQRQIQQAEAAWKAEEAARFTAAEAGWRKQSEAALAKAGLAAEQARENAQREIRQALSTAEAAWKADESARFRAAEAEWKRQSAAALAELTVRCERAESALLQARTSAARERAYEVEIQHVGDEFERMRSTDDDPMTEVADPLPAPEYPGELPAAPEQQMPEAPIISNDVSSDESEGQALAPQWRQPWSKRHLIAAICAAALLGTVLVLGLRMPSDFAKSDDVSTPAGSSSPTTPVPAQAAERHPTATVVRGVNLRAGPSSGSEVLSTLRRGLKVAVIERRGNWRLVRSDAEGKQGWVFNSFLQEDGRQVESSKDKSPKPAKVKAEATNVEAPKAENPKTEGSDVQGPTSEEPRLEASQVGDVPASPSGAQ